MPGTQRLFAATTETCKAPASSHKPTPFTNIKLMYICMHKDIDTHAPICISIYICTYTYTYVYVYVCVCMWIHLYIYTPHTDLHSTDLFCFLKSDLIGPTADFCDQVNDSHLRQLNTPQAVVVLLGSRFWNIAGSSKHAGRPTPPPNH